MYVPRPMLPLLLSALFSNGAVHAAAPVDRLVIRHSEVRFHGAEARPIGTIDFSASDSRARRLGPWDVNVKALEASGKMRFSDDGTVGGNAVGRHYQRMPDAGRRCTTHGSVTVCR